MVSQVFGPNGRSEGFIVASDVSFQFVEGAIDVPSQQQGVTKRLSINLRSDKYAQYFGEGVERTDISGRTITLAGWSDEQPLTAPLPHWRADEVNGTWTADFRRNAADASTWRERYRAADCAAVPARS
ncbi:MAG: hypothetical protein DCF31_04670 [Alphaproteobacteria bacterium]|nr:MAG: hypothetical protein DCF31_04670 [Alphaproteobacteria bacterium]